MSSGLAFDCDKPITTASHLLYDSYELNREKTLARGPFSFLPSDSKKSALTLPRMIGDITARMATYGITQYTVDEHRHVLILRICFI